LLGATLAVLTLIHVPTATADNKRLNDNVVLGIYNLQHQAGCRNDVTIDMRLQTAAEWHTRDLMAHPELSGDTGSDGSTPQSRAAAAGFAGQVAQTIAIYPSFALNNREVMLMWQNNPAYLPIMSNCAFSKMGVWSENSFDRSILVAVYGAPS
jgi:outer membrane autotransporter protein